MNIFKNKNKLSQYFNYYKNESVILFILIINTEKTNETN